MRKTAITSGLLAILTLAITAWAQEGHPLSGTWHGEWGASARKTPVVLYMQWETRMLTGMINPGPNAIHLKIATLNPEGWQIHLEAETKDAQGDKVPIVVDGKLGEDLGSYNRSITGTWMQGTAKGPFKLTRD
jgi:hypothetical protein